MSCSINQANLTDYSTCQARHSGTEYWPTERLKPAPFGTQSSDAARASDGFASLDPASVKDTCEQLKLRMLAAALFADPGEFVQMAETDCKIDFSAVTEEPGHTRHVRVGHNLLILLPELDSDNSCTKVAEDLLTIFYNRIGGARLNWIIDFSSVRRRPKILFMGTLCSLRKSLTANGGTLIFSWLRSSLFPGEFGSTICKAFQLRPLGEYLVPE